MTQVEDDLFRLFRIAPSISFRTYRNVRNLFDLIKNCMDKQLQTEFNNKTGEVDLSEFQKYGKCTFATFDFSEKNQEDLDIFKRCMEKYSVKYSLVKGETYKDGIADYRLFFDAKSDVLIQSAFKDFLSAMDKKQSREFSSRKVKAKEAASEHNKNIANRDVSRDKVKNKNKDFNIKL